MDQATCGQKGSEWTREQVYPAEIQSVKIAEGWDGEGHTALGEDGGGLGECHACAIFHDRVRDITLLWTQAFNKVLNFPPKITEYEARIARPDEGWDLFKGARRSEETVFAFRLRDEDEGRVRWRGWWGGGREVGDRKGVIGKSGLKVADGEEGGGKEERDRGGRVAYSRSFVEEFVEIAWEQRVSSGNPFADGSTPEIATGMTMNMNIMKRRMRGG